MHRLPHVTPAMLAADFWLDRLPDPDAPLLDAAAIAAFNARVPAATGVPEVFSLGETIDADLLRDVIPLADECGEPASGDNQYYDVSGSPFSAATWAAIRQNTACDKLPVGNLPVRWGLVSRRTAVRAYPTRLMGLKTPGDLPFDRFQESTVDLGWPLAILHKSADSRWLFCLAPGYWGWLRAEHVAIGPRARVEAFAAQEPFLVATAPWAGIALHGGGGNVSAQMGTRLPLAAAGDVLHRVVVPTREFDGKLTFSEGYVVAQDPDGHARAPEWQTGYGTPTLRALLTRGFRLLGEPYAWGGERLGRAGRDCSRMVQDIWATAGVLLPRNSDKQGRAVTTVAAFAPEESPAERAARFASDVPAGALIFLPGHVMLNLGVVEGRPYALHDLWGYNHPDGRRTIIGAVVVSDLPVEPSEARHTLLERVTHAGVVR